MKELLRSARAAFSLLPLLGVCAFSAAPTVQVEAISEFGKRPGVISGRVTGVAPRAHQLAALIFVSGLGYFSKPSCSSPATPLRPADGSFSLVYTSGGIDERASRITLVVVPISISLKCYTAEAGVPEELEKAAAATLTVVRPDPAEREIRFAGERWAVKASPVPLYPGPNYFSDHPDNVFVDDLGRLHLRITNRDRKWHSAEVVSRRTFAYGTYTVTLGSSSRIDRSAVFGAFTWADAERNSREIDWLEIGQFGRPDDGLNCQVVVQPFAQPGHLQRFLIPTDAVPTTHIMRWEPTRVVFQSFRGTADSPGAKIHEYEFTGTVPPADSANLNVRLNLWLFAGPPSDARPVEVTIQDFRYQPLQADNTRPAIAAALDAAGYRAAVAPGGLLTVFGERLAGSVGGADQLPLPSELAGTTLSIGGLPAPLLWVSPGQVNAQVPYQTPLGTLPVVVSAAGLQSDPSSIRVDSAAPQLFTIPPNLCLVQNSDGSLNGPSNPARSQTVVTAYLHGLGQVNPRVGTGAPAPREPLSRPDLPTSAKLADVVAPLRFIGLVPDLVGVGQANVEIPATLAAGLHAFFLTIGDYESNRCLVYTGDRVIEMPF